MSAIAVIALAGLGSFALRTAVLVVAGQRGAPAVLERAAAFVVPVSFAALAASALAARTTLSVDALPVAAAVVVAAVAVRRTAQPHVAVLAGMPVLWLLDAVVAT